MNLLWWIIGALVAVFIFAPDLLSSLTGGTA